MAKKNRGDSRGFVYSTDPDFQFQNEEDAPQNTQAPASQKLRISLDRKQRAGKSVTLVTGFLGTNDDLEQLGKALKNYCGTGGSVKENEIIIQGDQREKVLQWLLKNGYSQTRIIR